MDLPAGAELLRMNKSGFTYQQIADVFGVTRNTVAGRIAGHRRRVIALAGGIPEEAIYIPEHVLTVPVQKDGDLPHPVNVGFEVSKPSYADVPRMPIFIDTTLAPLPHERYKPCVLDIETTDFSATEGAMSVLVCAVIAPLNKSDGDQAKIFRLQWPDTRDERGMDYRLLQEVIEELLNWDVIIGHNVGRFDINWLISRVMQYHGFPPRVWQYFDTLSVARSLAWLGRKGLAPMCASLGIPAIKTSVQKASWADVYSTKRDDFEYIMDGIVHHCVEDVKANRILFDYLYPYSYTLRDNPNKITKWRVGVPR